MICFQLIEFLQEQRLTRVKKGLVQLTRAGFLRMANATKATAKNTRTLNNILLIQFDDGKNSIEETTPKRISLIDTKKRERLW